jgi:hypothetical protein
MGLTRVGMILIKNWVFVGGIIDHVVYSWHPKMDIGRVNQERWEFKIHREIDAPASFDGMRKSTNGVFHQGGW